ncbi:Protein phosphatase 2C/pyruvate dehydrogenase (lipoamide) phosphatase [Handroanthus impetiginosus]|uniref:protein-serine/threonine phosphatase n=1 Tax=Handroanthus impetiginosus TaxID=429701 RepID=A0A2G9GEI2_9LAMI|nr:Protein phosphatase 2C/pyruvate dehydrogenase (lipoamide) phosphatase [Handroanthus impetiginosus]
MLKRAFKKCVSCLTHCTNQHRGADDGSGWEDDKNLSYEDLRNHAYGQFSTAVVQANANLEDRLQVEVGRQATFVGVYDGHAGADAAEYVNGHLFGHLTRLARQDGRISEDIIRNAFAATESGLLNHVRNGSVPRITGTCCLVGIMWNGKVFVANLGDSRVVTGYVSTKCKSGVIAFPISDDHNANVQHIRNELFQLHREDPGIASVKRDRWRVKGILQVTRSIGDFYLKHQEFHLDESFGKFYVRDPIVKPVIRADPELQVWEIRSDSCKFFIFASDGLWDQLTNQEVVDMVQQNPREGIARRLAVRAMSKAAAIKGKKYVYLKSVTAETRRTFHDDISVVVIFVDNLQPVDEGTSTSVQSNFNF